MSPSLSINKTSALPQQVLINESESCASVKHSSSETSEQFPSNKNGSKHTETVELCTALAGQNVDTKGDQQSKDSSSLSRVHQIKELKKGKPGLVSENQGSSPNRGTIVAEQRKEETEKAKVRPSSPVAPKSLHQKNSTHLSQKENVGATVTGRGTGSPLRERVTATPTRGKMAVAKVGGVQAAHNRVEVSIMGIYDLTWKSLSSFHKSDV